MAGLTPFALLDPSDARHYWTAGDMPEDVWDQLRIEISDASSLIASGHLSALSYLRRLNHLLTKGLVFKDEPTGRIYIMPTALRSEIIDSVLDIDRWDLSDRPSLQQELKELYLTFGLSVSEAVRIGAALEATASEDLWAEAATGGVWLKRLIQRNEKAS